MPRDSCRSHDFNTLPSDAYSYLLGMYLGPACSPRHGPGQKHLRPIILRPWQQAHVEAATEHFVRLIHSDGCRVVADDRGVAGVRYHFTNRSTDIRELFCAALDSLGIPWTQNSRYMIAAYRKAATARLDEFIGPKA